MDNFSFRDWFDLVEIVRDVERLPTDNIHIDQDSYYRGYNARFSVAGEIYGVRVFPVHKEIGDSYNGKDVEVYDISFEGPNGYSLTGKNSGASTIYSHLLASVVKIVNQLKSDGEQVNGFHFYPADPAMGLMYKKFYEEYLKPAGFLQVSGKVYLSRDYIKSIAQEVPSIYKKILNANRNTKAEAEQVRLEKMKKRSIASLAAKMVGNAVMYKNQYDWNNATLPGILISVDSYGYMRVIAANRLDAQILDLSASELFKFDPQTKQATVLAIPTKEVVSQLLTKIIADGRFYQQYKKYIDNVAQQYGLTHLLQPKQAEPEPGDSSQNPWSRFRHAQQRYAQQLAQTGQPSNDVPDANYGNLYSNPASNPTHSSWDDL